MHSWQDSSSKAYSHPAFGQISASRVSGSSTLYGSDFLHHNYISIRINRSELNRDLNRDWHFSKEELIEVNLSEAQWATFVSSLNVGGGVPCTINHLHGEQMPGIPLRQTEDVFKAEFAEKAKRTAERVDAAIADIQGELGSSLSKSKREKILSHLEQLRMDIGSNMPFVARSFEEHMERTVEKAKIEVNAYIQTSVTRAGLAAIAGANAEPLELGPGSTEPEE